MDNIVTVITTTTGRDSLTFLIDSIKRQNTPVKHIILWNDNREGKFLFPSLIGQNGNAIPQVILPSSIEEETSTYTSTSIVTKGNLSFLSLKSIGLMMADTDFVTFADDNVMWEPNHLQMILKPLTEYKVNNWAYCQRRMWAELPNKDYEYLGVDNYESMGDEAKTNYKMIDNNCIVFKRRLGTSASVMYRESKEDNGDKLMFDFLKKHGGNPYNANQATVNIVCENHLVEFFRSNCTH